MKNYIVIDGEKIRLSNETVENLKKTLRTDDSFVPFVSSFEDSFTSTIVKGDLHTSIQIGAGAVKDEMRGKCLILSNDYDWKIINNPASEIFTKMLVAKKKSK
jgi:hypothetical protein